MEKIICGDSKEVLKTLEAESVQVCITSPPYFGLRDYGMEGQIGLEETPEEYTQKLVGVFREVRRVLRKNGTLWLNLGDSFYNYRPGKGSGQTRQSFSRHKASVIPSVPRRANIILSGLKEKDLIGIPWRVAFALQVDGWYLRSDIIWAKKNCMPESVQDRPTRSHEYIFLFSKSSKYYYDADAIKEPSMEVSLRRAEYGWKSERESVKSMTHGKIGIDVEVMGNRFVPEMRNKRDVWSIATKPYKEAHFAVFPPELIEPCVLAGAPLKGIVLDPFLGSGTTAEVALKLGRDYLGIELNPAYVEIAKSRINSIPSPLF